MKKFGRSLLVSLLLLSTVAFAQPDSQKQSDSQKTFEKLKFLAGTWEGRLTTDPVAKDVQGKIATVTLRVTSTGNAMLHEINIPGRPDDPITMLYVENDKLTLTHYCDAGNRPRMTAAPAPDGKSVSFELVDVSGPMKYGHMHHAGFNFIDADHHSEDWTYMAGEKPIHVHFELTRKKDAPQEGK